jgi:hypothetical protein
MRDTIDMAREVYGAHTEWSGAPLDRLEQLVALVRADQREIDAAVWRGAVEAEREACAKVCERIGNPSNFDYVGVGGVACAEAIRARGNT